MRGDFCAQAMHDSMRTIAAFGDEKPVRSMKEPSFEVIVPGSHVPRLALHNSESTCDLVPVGWSLCDPPDIFEVALLLRLVLELLDVSYAPFHLEELGNEEG